MGTKIGTLPGGLLIPERCQFSSLAANTGTSTTSNYTEASPRPGAPVYDDQWSRLRVEVSGEQGYEADFTVTKGGMPARDGMQMVFRRDGETPWMLYDSPSLVNDFIPMDWGSDNSEIHAIATIPTTQKVVVACLQSANTIKLRVIDTDHTVTEQSSTIPAGSNWNYPALIVLPESDRVVCFHGGSAYFTDDEGATWTLMSEGITEETTTNYGPTVACVYRNAIVLFVEDTATPETIHHLVSTDGGHTFTLVQSTASLGVRVDCVANDDGIHVIWVDQSAAVEYRKLGTAFEPLDAYTVVTLGTGSTSQEACIWADGTGTVYALLGDNDMSISASFDAGETWADGNHRSPSISMLDTSDNLGKMKATYALGQAFVVCGWYNGASFVSNRASVVVLGGWSDLQVTGDSISQPYRLKNRWGWSAKASSGGSGTTYFCFDSPANQGWTSSGGGATGGVQTDGTYRITSSANELSFSKDLGASLVSIVADFQLLVSSGGSTTTQDVAATIRLSDAGSFEYEIEILFSTAAVYLNDVNSASTANAAVTLTSPVQFRVWISQPDEEAILYYRTPGQLAWTALSVINLTSAGATANNSRIQWGNIASATATSGWRSVCYAGGATQYPKLTDGSTALTGGQHGRFFNARPEPVPHIGTSTGPAWVAAVAGPSRTFETFTVPTAPDYPIEAVHVELHPGRDMKWRSTDTSEQIGCYDLGSNGFMGYSVGLYVRGANFRTIYLESSLTGSSWATRATLDLAEGFTSLSYTLPVNSDVLYPNLSSGSAADRWLWDEEKRGGLVICNGTGGPKATRTLSQTAGGWQTSAAGTTLVPTFRLEDVTDIAGITGTLTCHLCSPDGFVVAHDITAAASPLLHRYWRWRIPAGTAGADTPRGESYYEASTIMLGRVQAFGAEVDWGNTDEAIPNVSDSEDEAGVRRVRELGLERRTWVLGGWAGAPTNLTQLRLGPNGDYVASTDADANPLAGAEDVFHLLRGVWRITGGGSLPVLAMEPIPDTSGQTVTDPSLFLYGHLTGSVQATRATGDAGDSTGQAEVLRVADITIREIP